MDNLSGIPEEVPQEYKDQLLKFQNQIKVLLQNYQVSYNFKLIHYLSPQ